MGYARLTKEFVREEIQIANGLPITCLKRVISNEKRLGAPG
jgi:hypothetical protein